MRQFDSGIIVELKGMMGCIVVYTTQYTDIESVGSTVSQAIFPFPCAPLYFKKSPVPVSRWWPEQQLCYRDWGKSSNNSLLVSYILSLSTTLLTGAAKIVS